MYPVISAAANIDSTPQQTLATFKNQASDSLNWSPKAWGIPGERPFLSGWRQ